MKCKWGATYLVTIPKGKYHKDHAFSCGKHLGETVRGALEVSQSKVSKVTVTYCPKPGDQPCEWGVE